MLKKIFFCLCLFVFISSTLWADDTEISAWFSKTAIDSKVKRKFEAKFKIKLGEKWEKEKPEILIKTLDANDCILQVSNVVSFKDQNTEIELMVPHLKDFKSFRLCLRSKYDIENFRQNWEKREKKPEYEEQNLSAGEANVIFFKKMDVVSFSKTGNDCKMTGIVMNTGSAQARDIKVEGVIKDALGKKIKEFDFLITNEGKPIILDGGDKFVVERSESGVKGFAGGGFKLQWDGGRDKLIQVDSGVVTSDASVFEFGKTEGEVQITKVVAQMVNAHKDLNLTITIYNGLDKAMFNPVITIKLTNEKGEVIQPITLEFEGELGAKETAEIPFEHKNAPLFNGLTQSLKYSTK